MGYLALLAALVSPAPARAYDWLQFNGDPGHAGNNVLEHQLGAANVATLAQRFKVALPATAAGAPVALRGVALPTGPTDMLFVTTQAGDIVALNAATGAQIWTQAHGPGTCRINNTGGSCYTTSSPALDPNRNYVYSYGLDGYVHKHAVTNGAEVTTGGWPELTTLKGYDEKGSSALAVAASGGTYWLYAVHGGYPGDQGDYQGHVTAIDVATGSQKVFNTMCSDTAAHFGPVPAQGGPTPPNPYCTTARSAIWSRPGVIYDSALRRIFVATGNGLYTGSAAEHNWSESVLALNPDATGSGGKPIDAYTPSNFQALDNADADVGSTVVAILSAPAGSAVANIGVQGGKDAMLRLVDLSNLSGQGGPGHLDGQLGDPLPTPLGGGVFAQPAVWVDPIDNASWVFVVTSQGLAALKLQLGTGGAPYLATQWTLAYGGTSPVIANNVLYYVGGGLLRALDSRTGNLLWSSPTGQLGSIHWQSPIVFHGSVYVTDENAHLTAYAPLAQPASVGFDFDSNAKADLAWRNAANGQTSLWLMNGLSAASTATISTDPTWTVTATGDLDGDDKTDLIWRSTAGATRAWLMNGTAVKASATLRTDPAWTVEFVADFNGDGCSDLLWRNTSTGAVEMWLMNGLTEVASAVIYTDPNWRVTHVGDFNGDGKTDLVWHNATSGQTSIWLMDGLTRLASQVVQANTDWSVTTVGDFNGDEKSDLVWHNAVSGATSLWLMNGTAAMSYAVVLVDPNFQVTHVGDFNADGKDDLVWHNSATGMTTVWMMDGVNRTSYAIVQADKSWSVVDVADNNGDGNADLLWANSTTGAVSLWLMNGATFGSYAVINSNASLSLVTRVAP